MKKPVEVKVVYKTEDNTFYVYRAKGWLKFWGFGYIASSSHSPFEALQRAQKRLFNTTRVVGHHEITESKIVQLSEDV